MYEFGLSLKLIFEEQKLEFEMYIFTVIAFNVHGTT